MTGMKNNDKPSSTSREKVLDLPSTPEHLEYRERIALRYAAVCANLATV